MRSSTVNAAKIPADVLVQIFLLFPKNPSSPYNPADEDAWDWTCVTEVCSYWHAVATETPKLWTYIHPGIFCSAKLVDRYLLLSKNSCLEVDYAEQSWLRFVDSLKTVLKQLRRIRNLSIAFPYSEEEMEKLHTLLEQPAPMVESITFRSFFKSSHFTFPITSPGILQRVDLHSFDLSSNMSRLSGLKELKIKHCSFSLSELLEGLEASPELSTLFILRCEIRRSPISKSVHLSNATSVHLSCDYLSDLYDVLLRLELPNLIGWKVKFREILALGSIERLDVLSNLLKRECDLEGISITTIRLFDQDSSRFTMTVHKDPSLPPYEYTFFKGLFKEANFDPGFQRLVVIFGSYLAKAENLNIVVFTDTLMVDSWRSLFRASVSTMIARIKISTEFKDRQDDEMNCIKALSVRPEEGSDVPCPALSHLDITWYGEYSKLDWFLSILEELLRSRSLRGSAVRVLSVCSDFYPRNDNEFRALSQWVQELKWAKLT